MLDPILHFGQKPRDELQAMKDRRAILSARFDREPKHSDTWFELAGALDQLADDIFVLEQERKAEDDAAIDRIRAFQMGGHSGKYPWDADA